MKLSEVAVLLDFLRNTDIKTSWALFNNCLSNLQSAVVQHQLQIGSVSHDLTNSLGSIQSSVNDFEQTIAYLQAQLEQVIRSREHEYYQSSLHLYEQEMRYETNDWILNRKLIIDPESNELMLNRIRSYSDWRLPGLIIRPGLESFIEHMVPLDPLYVVDTHEDLIKPAIEKFTPEYRRRLRPYIINDYTMVNPLEALPDNQFGFIFAYNFLNYKPMPVIERYLNDFWKKLRPGGVVVFTFNNCDLPQGLGLAEQHFMCYTPGHVVRWKADQIGFENLFNFNQGRNDVSWLELKKPGEIKSARGSQVLARIVRK